MKHSRRIFRRIVRFVAIYTRWTSPSNCRGSKAF